MFSFLKKLTSKFTGPSSSSSRSFSRKKKHHQKAVQGMFICSECSEKCNSPTTRGKHMKMVHKPYIKDACKNNHCQNCGLYYPPGKHHQCVLAEYGGSFSRAQRVKRKELPLQKEERQRKDTMEEEEEEDYEDDDEAAADS